MEEANIMKRLITLFFILSLLTAVGASCKKKTEQKPPQVQTETPVPKSEKIAKLDSVSVEEGIAQIDEEIDRYQTSEVWPGGTPQGGCYTWDDRNRFLSGNGIQTILNKAKGNTNFIEGVIAIKSLPKEKLSNLFREWRKPVYPTWAMQGHIGPDGTTDAGYQTQQDIADALVTLVEELLKYSKEEIVKIWEEHSMV
jgi:hypothetical protein